MIELTEAGIYLQEGTEEGLTVPWEVLSEHGIFRTSSVKYYSQAHPEVLARAVWAVWRAHVMGGNVDFGGALW